MNLVALGDLSFDHSNNILKKISSSTEENGNQSEESTISMNSTGFHFTVLLFVCFLRFEIGPLRHRCFFSKFLYYYMIIGWFITSLQG